MASDRYALPPSSDAAPEPERPDIEREIIPRGANKRRMAYFYGGRGRFRRALARAKRDADAQP